MKHQTIHCEQVLAQMLKASWQATSVSAMGNGNDERSFNYSPIGTQRFLVGETT